ncbi:FYVE and coiled-coil domain-containing protein 1-like [Pogonomyrmex barbatus]|uniref:FYVE and coiled-coil domain-containing protein 1-like n=1 Tax=Pogonomyrmex barbatus TaxID=144034 RepID=A0A6I9WAS0_9HYME|nr:FYVE and coiled-coil domain-containing protein 1-like [Pogonomyrmex barbatus]
MRHAESENCRSVLPKSLQKKTIEKSTNIAQKAAQEAKAASEAQNIVGQQAARQVKAQLAEKAVQAAKAAEAVLPGKEAMVEQLRNEVKEARSVVREETSSLQQAQANVNVAVQAAQQSQDQLKTLTNAIRMAKSNAASTQIVASGAQKSLREKEELLEAAKRRVDELLNQLQSARQDLANTNRAVAKANAAANEAKINAARNKRKLAHLRKLRAAHLGISRAS